MSAYDSSYMTDMAFGMMGGAIRNSNSTSRNACYLGDDTDDLDFISDFNSNGLMYTPLARNGFQCPSIMNQGPSLERQDLSLEFQRLGLEYQVTGIEYQEPISDYHSAMRNTFDLQNQGNAPYDHEAGFEAEEPFKNNISLSLENNEATHYVPLQYINVREVGDLVDKEEEVEEEPGEFEAYNKIRDGFHFQDPSF